MNQSQNSPFFPEERETILNLLRDLNHDLGKYLTLALRFLPSDAGDSELSDTVADSLHRTRNHQDRHESAESIWHRYRAELDPHIKTPYFPEQTWNDLAAAMSKVLSWGKRLPVTCAQRPEIHDDFFRVPALIKQLIKELS